ncbi:MAG: LytTR family DNA-binding domain-containing protein [Ferruginibacter sp.]
MKVVIIEDEKLSADHLTLLLKKVDSTIEIVKYIDTVKATVSLFEDGLQCDLIFMDIHLADGNSFEVFNKIVIEIPIIFTTAYDNYAIQAFKQNSIDYLLKPVTLQDVQFAMDKYNKQQQKANKHLFESFAKTYQQLNHQYKTRFIVKVGETIDTVQTNEIHHFETKESVSFLVTNKGKKYIVEYTLDQLEKILPPQDFFRINRKIIIHIQAIEKVKTYFNSRLSVVTSKLDNDAQIVSRERVIDFKRWLDN